MTIKKLSYLTIIIYFIFSLGFFLSSCMSIKPGATKSGKKYYQTFFVGEDGTQYFIKPFILKNDNNEHAEIDIIFRYKDAIKDSAKLNISFVTSRNIKKIDEIIIKNNNTTVNLNNINFMFTERKKDMFKCRYNGSMDLNELKTLFQDNDWEIYIKFNNSSISFNSLKKTNRIIEAINYEIFELF